MSTLPAQYIGHDEIRANLMRLIATNKLPSTMLFSGLPGVGKKTLATLVARSLASGITSTNLFNEEALRTLTDCTSVFSIDASVREESQAESIRELIANFYRTSAQGKARVCIIDNAEEIPVISANILLKSLEEPRSHQYFILTSSNPSKILPTILSRCHRFSFAPLSSSELELIIQQQGWQLPVSAQEAAFLADGSLSAIKDVGQLHEEWVRLSKIFDRLTAGDLGVGISAIASLGKDKEKNDIINFLTLLRLYLRQRLITTLEGKWSTAIMNVMTAWRYIFERNLSSTLILTNLIIVLSHTGKKSLLLEEQLEPSAS